MLVPHLVSLEELSVCWLCQTMLVPHFSATGGALCLLVVKLCWSLHLVSLEELSICWLSNYVGPSLSITRGALCLLVVSNYVGPSLSITRGALCLLVVSNYVGPSLQCHWRSSLFVGCVKLCWSLTSVPLEELSEKVSCWTEFGGLRTRVI